MQNNIIKKSINIPELLNIGVLAFDNKIVFDMHNGKVYIFETIDNLVEKLREIYPPCIRSNGKFTKSAKEF